MYSYRGKEWARSTLLLGIIIGNYSVVKLPWKPKVAEQYSYCLSPGHAVVSSTWRCAPTDLCYWKAGNCFKTEEEARIKGKEILEQIKKEFEEA